MQKDYFFTFDGINSNSFGLKIKDWNYMDSPEKDIEEVHVPGRNGSLFIDNGGYKNRVIDIICLVDLREADKNRIGTKLNEWLLFDSKYKELCISDDEMHKFQAVCINTLSFTEILRDYFEVMISFSAKPFKEENKEEPIILTKELQRVKIYNDSPFEAEPIIDFKCTVDGTVVSVFINDVPYGFSLHPEKEFTIDSEKMHVYREVDGIVENYNKYATFDEFPVLLPGENEVYFSGNIKELTIHPNIKYL